MGYEPASEVQFHAVLEEECSGNGCLAVLEAGFSKVFFVTNKRGRKPQEEMSQLKRIPA